MCFVPHSNEVKNDKWTNNANQELKPDFYLINNKTT